MKKIIFIIFILFISGCSQRNENKLTIATAANVQFAMKDLIRVFEQESGIACDMILGSSGQLNAQIKAGAPYDVFVSANMKYPRDLEAQQLTAGNSAIYAYGILVLWSTDSTKSTIGNLASSTVNKIAVANPATAPYGEAAIQLLERTNLLKQIQSKIIYGESISQVNQFIKSGAADMGFTAKSAVLSEELKNTGRWIEVDQSLYDPIEQGIVVLKGEKQAAAEKFMKFILSSKAKEILKAQGYRV